ncbi:MATE family efflux transporter [Methanoculleus horonobensis]|uniref:MATE family efflux transporter n=1 Tax=Methanoculleus horonobensis TaxID=528314 RepID=UPI000834541D|nr:MATE family efflux transporter [Methanoculleus horonobensis]MDD3070227.1 MATE family efflux transporter [Methanoculleus horonobensis]MDD4251707.1 MATE family efflux transporter [Methanoculleus horonobensis]
MPTSDSEDDTPSSSNQKETEGTKILLADPKTAILRLSLPMMVAMTLMTLYNVVDAFWVSGLGADALAAVGFSFPLFIITIGLASGLGTGGEAALARTIGARDRAGASSVAMHTILLMTVLAVVVTIPLFLFAQDIFVLMGAGDAVGLATEYARILFLGTFALLFGEVAYALMHGEGDAKRTMYAMAAGAVANIILDPILIYGLDMGIAGAAWATILAEVIAAVPMAYWLFVKRDTYIALCFRKFRPDTAVVRNVLQVGLPAAAEQLALALMALILNGVIVLIASTDGVAVYSVGWRVVSIGLTPILAISSAVVAVTGATYGARAYARMETALRFAARLGLGIGIGLAAATFVFAPGIAAFFTVGEAAGIAPELTTYLRVMSLVYPMVGFGLFSASFFQGTGLGTRSLTITILQNVVLSILFAWIFAAGLGLGLSGIWWGVAAGNAIGAALGYAWARRYSAGLQIRQAAPTAA